MIPDEKRKDVITKMRSRITQLEGMHEDKHTIAVAFADLEQDFEFVKNVNEQISIRYQEIVDTLPSLEELDYLLKNIIHSYDRPLSEKEYEDREASLTKIRSAVYHINLDKQKPQNYNLPKE